MYFLLACVGGSLIQWIPITMYMKQQLIEVLVIYHKSNCMPALVSVIHWPFNIVTINKNEKNCFNLEWL